MKIDIKQVVFAIQRARHENEKLAEQLHERHDYAAQFPYEDAERLGEALELIRQRDELVQAIAYALPYIPNANGPHDAKAVLFKAYAVAVGWQNIEKAYVPTGNGDAPPSDAS